MAETLVAGVAARLPESENIDEFWENLMRSKDMTRQTRWPQGLHGTPPRMGQIKNIDKFDAEYFSFEENEVHHMNPMLRHLLEVCSECIVDSGLCLPVLQGNITGLYLSCFLPDNDSLETSRGSISRLCTTVPMMAGHLMEHFGFSGPMMSVDTGCSSSLSALDLAVGGLKTGKCQFAIVTAVNLLLNPSYLQQMTQLGMLSPNGQTNVFDAKAGGYVRAEGVVSVLLTRNVSICKHVYVSVVDILTNCDGFKSEGITFPNSQSQAELMTTVYSRCGIDLNRISFVEAHSTGTKAGDPIEVAGICEALCKDGHKPLLIGSVKANIGHSEATAGLASFVKCIMIARHGMIPPQINFHLPNPQTDGIVQGKVRIVDKPTPLADGYIGLNSFGYGGSNGHLVLKPYRKQQKAIGIPHSLVTVKARNEAEMESFVDFIRKNRMDVSSLALLSNSWLSHDPKRLMRGYVLGLIDDVRYKVSKNITVIPSLWLMLRDVVWEDLAISSTLLESPIFKKSIQSSQQILSKVDDTFQLEQMLIGHTCESNINKSIVLAISTLIGIVDTIIETKVPIEGVLGSGLSEIVAGYKDGCLSRDQCVRLAFLIGQQIEKYAKADVTGRYSVYKTTLSFDEVHCLGPFTRVLSMISEDTFVVAVEEKQREEVLRAIHAKGGYYMELRDRLPLYSDWMNGLVDGIEKEVQKILCSPKYRSKRMISLSQNYAYGCEPSVRSLFDWSFLKRILTTPTTITTVMTTLPQDTILMEINLCLVTDHRKVNNPSIPCAGDMKSVLEMLGEIHLLGHDVSVQWLYEEVSFPLDVTAPSLGPLVKWNHNQSWLIPEWPEFYCRVKDDVEALYTISNIETEGIHSIQGLLLYHVLMAITEKHNKTHELNSGIEVFDMVWSSTEMDQEDVINTDTIHVETGKKSFVVEKDGETVLLSGKYRIYKPEESVTLPKIPGYDLDINENLKGDHDKVLLEKTEITWEDSWLDFLDTLLEFSTQWLEGPLLRIWVNPKSHMKEVKDCANMLAVLEGCTGLCKAGAVVLHTKVSQLKKYNIQKVANLSGTESSKVSLLMVYTIESLIKSSDRVLIYQGENSIEQVIGIILITEKEVVSQEFPLSMGWTPNNLEQLIPYMLAVHLLFDIAKIKENQTLLILPPIDTLCIYLMAIANELGVSVFTSSFDAEVRDVIDNLFPFVRVVSGERLEQNIKTLTQGEGCDVVIKFTSADFQTAISLTSASGKALFCTLPSPQEKINLSKNCSLIIPDLSKAVASFIQKSPEEIQLFLYNMQNGCIAEMSREGFPEAQGLKYNLVERSHFTHSVELDQVLSAIEDPVVNLNNQSIAEMMEADAIAMQRLQIVITTKPKDFSILVHDCSVNENHCDSLSPQNITRTVTPPKSQACEEVKMIYLPEINLQDFDEVFDTHTLTTSFITNETATESTDLTSTPMFGLASDQREKSNELTVKTPPIHTKPKQEMAQLAIPRLIIPSAISNFKRRAKMSLIVCSTSSTPALTSSLKTLLTPLLFSEPTIVPLNDLEKQPSLFCIHPITGTDGSLAYGPNSVISMVHHALQTHGLGEIDCCLHADSCGGQNKNRFVLGYFCWRVLVGLHRNISFMLQIPGHTRKCPFQQKVSIMPIHCVNQISVFLSHEDETFFSKFTDATYSYYKNAVQMHQENEPYFLIGYSFGSLIAMEMAMQLQEQGSKVGCLILLDGGPSYFYNQFCQGIQTALRTDQERCYIECGALINFLQMYVSVPNPKLILKILLSLKTLQERIDLVLDMTFGRVLVSPNPAKSRWLVAKEKLKMMGTPGKGFGFSDAAEELIRLKRQEAARSFINCVQIAYKYHSMGRKFKGDVHLLRVKSDLTLPTAVPLDYGLKDWCTGNVNVRFYNGSHESFLNDSDGEAVATDVMEIVQESC